MAVKSGTIVRRQAMYFGEYKQELKGKDGKVKKTTKHSYVAPSVKSLIALNNGTLPTVSKFLRSGDTLVNGIVYTPRIIDKKKVDVAVAPHFNGAKIRVTLVKPYKKQTSVQIPVPSNAKPSAIRKFLKKLPNAKSWIKVGENYAKTHKVTLKTQQKGEIE